jgi:hypothetical protein
LSFAVVVEWPTFNPDCSWFNKFSVRRCMDIWFFMTISKIFDREDKILIGL